MCMILSSILLRLDEIQNSHVDINIECQYCSIIRGECHLVARKLKRDYNAFLPIGQGRPANVWRCRAKVGIPDPK